MKKIVIEINPIELKTENAYVVRATARRRDWNVHYISETIDMYIVPKSVALKLKKANNKVRRRLVEEIDEKSTNLVFTSLCEAVTHYYSYPDDSETEYICYIPESLLKKMKENDLALIVVDDYDDYETQYLDIKVLTPEDLEKLPSDEFPPDMIPSDVP